VKSFLREEKGIVIFVVLVTLALAVCLWVLVQSSNDFAHKCQALGGHTKTITSTGTGFGVGAGGKVGPVVTSSSYSICLSSDGRILEPK
jgi:hypothetical protein